MQTQEKPYKLVFAITTEEPLGILIEPFAVLLTDNHQLSYTFKRINSITYRDYFSQGELNEFELEAIKYTDYYQKQNIVSKYNKNSKIKPLDFFKQLASHPQKEHIRGFIEKNIIKCLDIIAKNNLRLHYKGLPKDAINDENIIIHKSLAKVIFNFEKTDQETHYFLTISLHSKELSLKGNHNLLITNNPCYLYLNHQLFKFEDNFDSKKLKPFLTKDFVIIPKSHESQYFKTFVYKAIQKFNVSAKGFSVDATCPEKHAIIRLEQDWRNEPIFVLVFKYGTFEILRHKSQNLIVELLEEDGNFRFEKIYRDWNWEKSIEKELIELGLIHQEESVFTIPVNNVKGLTFEEKKHNLINFINENNSNLERLEIQFSYNIEKINYFTGNIKLDFKITEAIDWFDIQIYIEFGEHRIPFIKLKNHIRERKREYRLPDGQIAIIPIEWFSKYKEIIDYNISADQSSIKIKKHHYTLLNKLDQVVELQGLKKLNKFKKLKPPTIPEKLNATLRPYQVKGYNWIYFLQENEMGGCLADDMGLGKTLQALTMLLKIRMDSLANNGLYTDHQAKNPTQLNLFATDETEAKNTHCHTSLVIMPLSLVYNWEEEISRFAPILKVNKHIGSSRQSNTSYFKYYDIILTTYGVVRNDIEILKNFNFEYIILDESQIIKNPGSKIYKSVRLLNSKHKLVLTGTPIENSLIDLWSQMNFINPGLLGGLSFFKNEFVAPIERNNDKSKQIQLQEIISPFILRRTKETVAKDLPPLTEKIYYCEMPEEQKSIYEEKKSEIRNYIVDNISKYGTNKSRFIILKGLMQLRLLSNHPNLLLKDRDYESGKYTEVLRNIENLVAENHKVLIFSQFVKHLKIFEDYFTSQNILYSKITGDMSDKKRKEMIKEFQSDDDNKLFLISLKAGGVGLNLTAADYVFLLDPWWNPAAENQAINRAHRIGQSKNVIAYKFITKDSIEEKIHMLQQRKASLAEKFIKNNNPFKHFSQDEIYQLLQ